MLSIFRPVVFLAANDNPIAWPKFSKQEGRYVEFKVNMSQESIQSNFAPHARRFWIDLVPSLHEQQTSDCQKCDISSGQGEEITYHCLHNIPKHFIVFHQFYKEIFYNLLYSAIYYSTYLILQLPYLVHNLLVNYTQFFFVIMIKYD